jgi:NADH dehydrogenase (ubiquinone) Fe-S protein 5
MMRDSHYFSRVKCMSTASDPSDCKDVREDYLECLHHKKEFQRANAIQAEADRQRGEEAGKILEKIEKHVYDQSWAEVKKKEEK